MSARDVGRLFLCVVVAAGCWSTLACTQPSPFGTTLARGGALADADVTDMTTEITHDSVSTWGVIDVPDGSRLQAAYAAADALARAELLALIRVRVAGVMVSVDSSDPAHRQASEHVVEAVSGVLRNAAVTEHGWARVDQHARARLRVWSRLRVPRADVAATIRSAEGEGDIALPERAEAKPAGGPAPR